MMKTIISILLAIILVSSVLFIGYQEVNAKKYPVMRAKAGQDFTASVGSNVKLDGSDSKGGWKKFTSFEWQLVRFDGLKIDTDDENDVDIKNSDKKIAFFTPLRAGTYEFELTSTRSGR